MNAFIRSNRDLVKAMNRSLLLNIIRREGQLSRKQLTEISGLSVGSVSGIVGELLDNGWILEAGEGDFTGGRRQTMIRLNPDAGYAIGIKLMEEKVVCAITNFESSIIDYYESPIPPRITPPQLVMALKNVIDTLMNTLKMKPEQLLGVGIGLAGIIRTDEGIVQHSPYFGWRNLPLAYMLMQKLQRPVYIENDVNTLTLAEQLFGAGRHHDNFVVITIGRGVGLGIVIGNQIYRGKWGGAGEFGHIVIANTPNDTPFPTAQTLEQIASDPAIIASLRQINGKKAVNSLRDVVALAENGDVDAQNALALSGYYVGMGLANLVNILNPGMIIISGEGTIAGDYRLQPMIDSLRKHTFNGLMDDVSIVIEPTDDRAWARGAASLVISKVFESPIIEAQQQ
ncbi:MAG: ROK family transcriptional regulator [Anaerolineae bacterium]|nr:ROK family transcriptional regulator [Anaerolineae bacterium]